MARSDRSGAESANSANVRQSALELSPPTPPILLAGGVGDICGRVELADPRGGCTRQFRQFVPAGCIPRIRLCPDDGDERKDRHEAPPTVAEAHERIAEALADPFAWSVELLTVGVVRMPAKPVEPALRTPSPKAPATPRRRTAAEILRDRQFPGGDIGPLSNRSRRD